MRVPTQPEPRAAPLDAQRQGSTRSLAVASRSTLHSSLFTLHLHHVPRGNITLITGCMFSGKTTELLRLLSQHSPSRTLAVKHAIDTRYSPTQIVSHAGRAYPATVVAHAGEIAAHLPNHAEFVAIDEAHHFDETLVDATMELAGRGLIVALTALNPDSWGRPFPVGERLRAIADDSIAKLASCARCGAPADRTQRLTPIVDGYMIGGPESFEPRCRTCWAPPPPTDAPVNSC